MNDLDTLKASVAAISHRLSQLEASVKSPPQAAEAAGLPPDQRRKRATELHAEGLSYSQIARVLHCTERTVARYLQTKTPPARTEPDEVQPEPKAEHYW